jgi:hypothetical protein
LTISKGIAPVPYRLYIPVTRGREEGGMTEGRRRNGERERERKEGGEIVTKKERRELLSFNSPP